MARSSYHILEEFFSGNADGTSNKEKITSKKRHLLPKKTKNRTFGALKNKGHVDDSFFDPLSGEEFALWEGK
ncbi:hypothetical protein ACQZV8_19755 [Magnetococcales bacterium HHB-1]